MEGDTLMTAAGADGAAESAVQEAPGQQAAGAGQQQQASATPGAGGQAAGEKDEGGNQQQEKKPEGAPEKYEFQAQEGKEFDPETIEKFSAVAKELDMPQDKAQALIDKMAPALAARQADQIKAVKSQWAETSKADKEFGGKQLAENLGIAQKALDAFGSQKFKILLDDSGLGNHPEVIRFMVRAGRAIGEDGFVSGRVGKGVDKDARRLYAASEMNP
ncbi:MAG: hypothetical protein LBJ59_12245 [Zoogloeaceae bacterium]|jgi:hypothetical protein|nr:hypothetical protein [Zoogloeaceae bacterium]